RAESGGAVHQESTRLPSRWLRLKPQALRIGNPFLRNLAAELKGPKVGHDRPAIPDGNLICVRWHRIETAGHGVEELSQRHDAKAFDMEGGRRPVAALDDDPLTR